MNNITTCGGAPYSDDLVVKLSAQRPQQQNLTLTSNPTPALTRSQSVRLGARPSLPSRPALRHQP
jgi:hypothetical protein